MPRVDLKATAEECLQQMPGDKLVRDAGRNDHERGNAPYEEGGCEPDPPHDFKQPPSQRPAPRVAASSPQWRAHPIRTPRQ
jgi:hypothetical protein